jgi:hypothetical protein
MINKFFQKYATVLLIVFMSLLLVAFLLPPGMFNGGGGRGAVVLGHALGEEVTTQDIQRTESILNLAMGLGIERRSIDPLDAHLLMLEAKAAGIHLGPEFIRDQLANVPNINQVLPILRKRYNLRYEQIYAHVAEWVAIYTMMQQQLGTASPSEPRQILAYRDRMQQANLKCSVIKASDLVRHIPDPTEEELQTLFEAGRDRETAHTESELVYGYRQPAKVKLEVLTVNPAAIRDLVRIRDLEAEGYYETNRDQFMSKPDPDAEGPAPAPRQLTYDEAEDQVKEAMRPAKAIEVAQRLVNQIHRELRAPWIGAEITETGFRVAPRETDQIPFAEIKARFEKTQEYPIDYRSYEFKSQAELNILPGLGRARIQSGGVSISAADYAMRVEGLYTPTEGDGGLSLTLNQPSEVIVATRQARTPGETPTSQAFVFRVTAVKPAGPPESLDEVRPLVISNWRYLQAYDLAEQLATELYDLAQNKPLAAVIPDAKHIQDMLTYDKLKTGDPNQPEIPNPATTAAIGLLMPSKPANFTRLFQQIDGVPGGSQQLAEEIFAMNDPSGLPLSDRTFLTGNAANQVWIVSQLDGIEPLYEGPFAEQRNMYSQQDMQIAARLWLDSDAIQARTGWKPSRGG